MRLCGWKSYPKATIAFKKLVDTGLIYRKKRHGLGKTLIEGDAYLLLSDGAKKLRESGTTPVFSFEPKQAVERVSIVPLTHTLLVNDVLIDLFLFQSAYPNRFRIEKVDHERSMRRLYKDVFELFPDGFICPLIQFKKGWVKMPFFLELQHTSARDKERYQTKVRHYLRLFENKLQLYFETNAAFVLILTTNPEYVNHHVHWTEEVLTQLRAEEYRNWFCIGSFDRDLTPVDFFCTRRFFNPFNKSPIVAFTGLEKSI